MKFFRMIFGGVKEINTETYRQKYQPIQHILVDVRNNNEFVSGHIEGATNIPFAKLPKKISDLPKDKPIVCVCRSGPRGRDAAHLLQQQGFEASSIVGGVLGWRNEGGDLIRSN